MRDLRACLVCIAHYTFEYIGDLPLPDVQDVIEMYWTMKGGGKSKRRGAPDLSIPERMEIARDAAKELKATMKHISTQPEWVQQSFAMRNKSMDQLFPKK